MKFTRAFIRVFLILFIHLAPIWGFFAALITGGGVLISILEGIPLGRAIYFAWITATTVGYGDIVPTSSLARVVCIAVALIGLVNTGVLGAIGINAVLVAARDHLDLNSIRAQLPGSRAAQEWKRGDSRTVVEPELHERLHGDEGEGER